MDSEIERLRLELRDTALFLSASMLYAAAVVRGIAYTNDAFEQCVKDAQRLRRKVEEGGL